MIWPAVLADIPTIVKLEKLLFLDSAMGEKLLRTELEAGQGFLVGQGYGYALVRDDATLVDLTRLGVLPAWQNRGLGSLLLERVFLLGKETMLTVKKANELALGLYLRRGFSIVGSIEPARAWVMRRPATGASSGIRLRTHHREGPRPRPVW